ncbi:hypothetical protein [Kribbella deserti]|uniref:Uncharacterized protein n=1 Tax=Kribbella deserti TaxID=1926257 RepID=A0ABV6QUA9_9ACTN
MKKNQNATLVAVVAAVAVAAVVAGAVVASQQGPSALPGSGASPLGRPISTASSPVSPSGTPTLAPSTPAGVKKVKLQLAKLPKGRAPQLTYARGRKILGGAGQELTVPGDQQIIEVARLGNDTLVILATGTGTEMARFGFNEESGPRLLGVTSVTVDPRGIEAAYVTNKFGKDGGELKGGTITFEDTAYDAPYPLRKLSRPNDFELRVLSIIDGKVFFRSKTTLESDTWQLHSWDPASSKANQVTTVTRPTALSANGELAASMDTLADYASCSAVTDVVQGRRNWRTCDYSIAGFTPDATVAYGGSAYQDGYADGISVALNAITGNAITEWSGLSFRDAIPEDDQHLLIVADDGPETKGAIIRCTIAGGACELATELSTAELVLGS